MEDVLAVYTRPRDPDYPLVCLANYAINISQSTRINFESQVLARHGRSGQRRIHTGLTQKRHVKF
jgi:hypothetical protein